jgi:hypothetical protein
VLPQTRQTEASSGDAGRALAAEHSACRCAFRDMLLLVPEGAALEIELHFHFDEAR